MFFIILIKIKNDTCFLNLCLLVKIILPKHIHKTFNKRNTTKNQRKFLRTQIAFDEKLCTYVHSLTKSQKLED